MRKFSNNICSIWGYIPICISNNSKVSLLINVAYRTTTKISLNFIVWKSNRCIWFLNNKSITRWSSIWTTSRCGNYITNSVYRIRRISIIFRSTKISSSCCRTKRCCTKTNNFWMNGIISWRCWNFDVPLICRYIVLNWMPNFSRNFIRNSTCNT